MNCVFCKIASKQIPSQTIYEDDEIIAFKDLEPTAPVHVLFIPKKHIPSVKEINDSNSDLISHIFKKIADLSTELNLQDGFRVVTNCGENGGQSVNHLHFHVLGGRELGWPPG